MQKRTIEHTSPDTLTVDPDCTDCPFALEREFRAYYRDDTDYDQDWLHRALKIGAWCCIESDWFNGKAISGAHNPHTPERCTDVMTPYRPRANYVPQS